jgi:hypothetical protein
LTTPRAAALAGVLFALLFGATLSLIRVEMPEGLGDTMEWLDSQRGGILTATKLMPFAGIAFLWFIGSRTRRLQALRGSILRVGVFGQRSAVPGDDVRFDRGCRCAGCQ